MKYKEKINKKISTFNNKLSRFKVLRKTNHYLNYLEKEKINIFFLCSVSFVIFIVSNLITINKIQIFSSSVIISLILSLLPYFVIKMLYIQKKQKIIEVFPTYIINLKNYTQVSNDIIIAIRKTVPPQIIEPYIKHFNNLVQGGVSVSDAFDMLSEKIGIKRIKDFFISCEYCYINGGDFNKLLAKYAKVLNKINMQREKENQENFSTKAVMLIIIVINLYMIFGFCFANAEYKTIIINSFVGKALVNMNLISYILIFVFSNKLNELED